jgi:sulfite reductase (NADPH) flavoprotein alpha-component
LEYLDLFGAPTRGFYLALSKHAKDIVEKQILAELSLPRKAADFEAREAAAVTYASTLLEFPSARLMPMDLLDLVPLAKPRLYSIASSRNKHPGEVHLCLVTHDWTTSKGEERIGLSTGFLEKLDPEAAEVTVVAALVRSEVLKLPKNPATPVIMAGMGTGMAPFRAFIEERAALMEKGQTVGHMHLYFGARHERGEFLYRSELEGYKKDGLLTLRCAWSRDQAHKVYVQMLIEEDGDRLWQEVLRPEIGGSFYICGPIAPLPDIKAALVKIFTKHGHGAEYLEHLENTGRFATEVY